MTAAECGAIKIKSYQFIYTCIPCKTNQQKSRHCTVPYLWVPQLWARRLLLLLNTLYVYMEIRCMRIWNMVYLLCTICPPLGYFSCVQCCLMERVVVPMHPAVWRWGPSWMDGHRKGMNGVQEAVDSGWWKLGTECAAMCTVVARVSQNVNDCSDTTCISIIIRCLY